MLPDRVSNPGPLAYESGALPTALRGPLHSKRLKLHNFGLSECNRINFCGLTFSPLSLLFSTVSEQMDGQPANLCSF